jgi:hypothetical protein
MPLLPLMGQLSLADRQSYFGSDARTAFFESYKEIARQRFTIGLGDEEQELEALLTARTQQMDQFHEAGDENDSFTDDGDSVGGHSLDSGTHAASDLAEMGERLDENFRPTPAPSRMQSRRNVMMEDGNEDAPGGSQLIRQSSTQSMRSERNGGISMHVEDSTPTKSNTVTPTPFSANRKLRRQPSRSKSRGTKKRSLYSRQRQDESQHATEEEKARLFEHLNKNLLDRQDSSRPLSARSRFLLGCVQKGIFPQPSLIVRKNVTSVLSIASFGIGDELAVLFAASLGTLPLLERLSIADNNLTDVGLVPIVKALTKCTQLNSLDVSRNKVDRETAKALLLYISSPGCSLTHLLMANANVDDKEASEFVRVSLQVKVCPSFF